MALLLQAQLPMQYFLYNILRKGIREYLRSRDDILRTLAEEAACKLQLSFTENDNHEPI
jgi:hypothetical protein